MTAGYLRTEENHFLTLPWEKISTYPEEVQRLLGYYVSRPFCGHVEMTEPLEYLKAGGDLTKITMADLV